MSLNQYVVLYFVVFASLGISAGVIHKKYMTQTLRKYGKKYRREIIHKSKKEQIDIYINLCKQHNISNKFAKYLLFYHKIHKSLLTGWIVLVCVNYYIEDILLIIK